MAASKSGSAIYQQLEHSMRPNTASAEVVPPHWHSTRALHRALRRSSGRPVLLLLSPHPSAHVPSIHAGVGRAGGTRLALMMAQTPPSPPPPLRLH
jgi:hypothetical protein